MKMFFTDFENLSKKLVNEAACSLIFASTITNLLNNIHSSLNEVDSQAAYMRRKSKLPYNLLNISKEPITNSKEELKKQLKNITTNILYNSSVYYTDYSIEELSELRKLETVSENSQQALVARLDSIGTKYDALYLELQALRQENQTLRAKLVEKTTGLPGNTVRPIPLPITKKESYL